MRRGVAPFGLVLSLAAALSLTSTLQAAPNQAAPLPPTVEVESQDARGMTLRFTLPDLKITDVTIAGRAFKSVAIPGGGQHGDAGEPAVPSFTRFLAVPEGVGVRVHAEPVAREAMTGMRLAPVTDGEGSDGGAATFDAARYAGAGAPTVDVLVSEPMIFRDLRVVALTFLPVRYDVATEELAVAREIEVAVEFTDGAGAAIAGGAALAIRHRTIPPSFDRLYRALIVNYPGAEALGATVTPGTWLAICPNDTAVTNRLAHLVAWRQRKGSPAVVATTAQTGTSTAQIKSYIQTAFNSWPVPPEYVVLVGDAQAPYDIPTWYETLSGYGGEGDHPYATVSGTDILADLHIGRLSFSTLNELLLIVNKTVNYESQPYIQDPTWFTRACGVGDPASSGPSTIECMQWMKTRLLDIGFTQVDTVFSGSFVTQMATAFNRGDAIIAYRGWVGMSGWGNANTYQLTNGWRMPFAPIITCGTGSFAGGTSLSEGFLRANSGVDQPKGAIGAIGLATLGTHTRYNNCLFFGTLHGLIEERLNTMGASLTRGKLENYLNYNAVQPQWAEIYAYWPNLMGDPAVDVWTAFPAPVTVNHPATLAVGANSAAVTVLQEGFPIAGALVCLSKGTETYAVGTTDALGRVELPINAATSGSMLLTVTKHDMQPYLATISVGTANVHVGYVSATIDDASGSNDGIVNPGEAIGLRVQVRNTGTATATGVSAALTSDDPYVTILDGSETFPNIPPGGLAATTEDFDFLVDLDCPHQHSIRFGLDVTTAQGQYHSVIDLPVASATFTAGTVTLYNAVNGRLDPGETVEMSLVLNNKGTMTATAVSGTLISLTNFVTIDDPDGTFGTIATGGNGNNAGDRFTLTAAVNTYGGYLANFLLVTDFSGGVVDTTAVALTIGQRAATDPVGPDRYGYYAFDNTDTSYPEAPTYNWIELDPAFGGSGATEIVLGDNGDEQDKSRIIDLPFLFRYYGQSYTRATVCSNGWVSLGETYLTSYRNWTIPGAGGPAGMVAVFWDELYQQAGSSRCFQKYDAANHRWILEWSRFRNLVDGATETFEVIFYDPAYHPTDTGDGIIQMQYNAAVSSDATDGYATVGIEDPTQTDGVLYTYYDRYPLGAAPIATGRAIRFVPVLDSNMGTLRGVARNSFNAAPLPNTQVTVLGSGRVFFTGADGTYSGFVPQGTYDVVAAHPGFRPDTTESVVIVEGEATVVDFTLVDIAGPAITTTTHPHTANEIGPYPIPVRIVEYSGLAEKTLYYATNGGAFTALRADAGERR